MTSSVLSINPSSQQHQTNHLLLMLNVTGKHQMLTADEDGHPKYSYLANLTSVALLPHMVIQIQYVGSL